MPRGQRYNEAFPRRAGVLFAGVILIAIAIVARLLYLQLVDRDFLAAEGDDRILRTAPISAHRGSITDRFGEPLAVSTPVDSISVSISKASLAACSAPLRSVTNLAHFGQHGRVDGIQRLGPIEFDNGYISLFFINNIFE